MTLKNKTFFRRWSLLVNCKNVRTKPSIWTMLESQNETPHPLPYSGNFFFWKKHRFQRFFRSLTRDTFPTLKQESSGPTDYSLYIYSAKDLVLSKYERWEKMLLQPKDSCHQRTKQKKENHDWLQKHTQKIFAQVGWIPKEKKNLICTNF